MNYSYNLQIQPTHEAVKELCGYIAELYPDFSKTESKDFGDNSILTKFSNGKNIIIAETDFKKKSCIISSDIPIDELALLYDQKEKTILSPDRADNMNSFLHFLKRPKAVKYLWIPVILVILSMIFIEPNILAIGPFAAIAFLALGAALGWIWLLPAIPAALLISHGKSEFASKAFTMSLPLFGAAFLTAFIFIPEGIRVHISDIVMIIGISLVDISEIIALIVLIYIAALPYMIIDDISASRREKLLGKKSSKLTTFLGWVYAVLGSAAIVILGTSVIGSQVPITPNVDLYQMKLEAETEKIAARYGSDMLKIAEYSAVHNVTDWEYCPDEKLKGSWRNVFSGDIDTELETDGSTVRFNCGADGEYCIDTETGMLYRDNIMYNIGVLCGGDEYEV